MIIKSILTIKIIFILSLINVNSQINFTFSSGLGSYQMDELKSLNNSLVPEIPVSTKIVDNFPMTIFYEGGIMYNLGDSYFGVMYSYNSTGSRISYIDYSGEIKIDQIVSAYSIGYLFRYKLGSVGKLNYLASLGVNYLKTNYTLYEEMRIFDDIESESIIFNASSYTINPAFEVSYIYKSIELTAYAGYCFDATSGNFEYEEEDVSIDGRTKFNPNWSGVRLGIRLSIEFQRKQPSFKALPDSKTSL